MPTVAQRALDKAFGRQVGVMAKRVRLQDAVPVVRAHVVLPHVIRVECNIAQQFQGSGPVHPTRVRHIPLAVYLARVGALAGRRPNWNRSMRRQNIHLARHRRCHVPGPTWRIRRMIVAAFEFVFTPALFFTSPLAAEPLAAAPCRPRLPARKILQERTRCGSLFRRHVGPHILQVAHVSSRLRVSPPAPQKVPALLRQTRLQRARVSVARGFAHALIEVLEANLVEGCT